MRRGIWIAILLGGLAAGTRSQTGPPGSDLLGSSALVPAVVSTEGAFGTRWVTTLALANPQAVPITLRLYLLPSGADNRNHRSSERVVSLPAQGGTRITDPLTGLWRRNGLAAIRIEATDSAGNPAAFAVESRIRNIAGEEASYGLPLSGGFSGITAGDYGYGADAESSARYSTDVGLVNDSGEPATAFIELFRDDGALLGSRNESLAPFSPIQIPVTAIAPEPFSRATVRVTPGSSFTGRLIGYLAVVDRATGDAIVHALRRYRPPSLPTRLTIELSRYRFSPGGPDRPPVVLRVGGTYELTFRSVEGTHGLSGIPQLGISGSPVIEPERDYVVTVTPGEEHRGALFNFACTVFCGVGHGGMYGAILVD